MEEITKRLGSVSMHESFGENLVAEVIQNLNKFDEFLSLKGIERERQFPMFYRYVDVEMVGLSSAVTFDIDHYPEKTPQQLHFLERLKNMTQAYFRVNNSEIRLGIAHEIFKVMKLGMIDLDLELLFFNSNI